MLLVFFAFLSCIFISVSPSSDLFTFNQVILNAVASDCSCLCVDSHFDSSIKRQSDVYLPNKEILDDPFANGDISSLPINLLQIAYNKLLNEESRISESNKDLYKVFLNSLSWNSNGSHKNKEKKDPLDSLLNLMKRQYEPIMFQDFWGHLNLDSSPLKCRNTHCKDILAEGEGHFCFPCYKYYAQGRNLASKNQQLIKTEEEPKIKKEQKYEKEEKKEENKIKKEEKESKDFKFAVPLPLKGASKYDLLTLFPLDMDDDDHIHCRNKYCRATLLKSRDGFQICVICANHYRRTGVLRGKFTPIQKRNHKRKDPLSNFTNSPSKSCKRTRHKIKKQELSDNEKGIKRSSRL